LRCGLAWSQYHLCVKAAASKRASGKMKITASTRRRRLVPLIADFCNKIGTEPPCAHVRIRGEYRRVSGLTADRTIEALYRRLHCWGIDLPQEGIVAARAGQQLRSTQARL